MIVLDVKGMPKHIDWCFLQRRDTVLTGVNAAFRQFVFEEGAALAACRVGWARRTPPAGRCLGRASRT